MLPEDGAGGRGNIWFVLNVKLFKHCCGQCSEANAEPVHTGTGRNYPPQQNDESVVVGGCSSLVYGEEGGAEENFYFGSGSISAI